MEDPRTFPSFGSWAPFHHGPSTEILFLVIILTGPLLETGTQLCHMELGVIYKDTREASTTIIDIDVKNYLTQTREGMGRIILCPFPCNTLETGLHGDRRQFPPSAI